MKALSPSSSSLFPCLKLRPEKPKLNLNPGIFCASLSCTESISYKSVTAKGRLSFKLFFLSFNSSRGHYVTANNCLRTKVHSCATQKKNCFSWEVWSSWDKMAAPQQVETIRGMGTSFRHHDFWDRLGGQALVMIGRWYSRQPLTNQN